MIVPLVVIGGIVAVVVLAVSRNRREDSSHSLSPRDIFTYLLAAATLYITASGVLMLVWGLAEYWFPDPLRGFGYSPMDGGVRVGISMAVVAFPIFVYLSMLVRRWVRAGSIQPDAPLRVGFIYFNLFVVAVTTLITLIATVNSFLGGDLTPRFLVRAGGVLAVAGLVYLYYRGELGVAGPNSGPAPEGAGNPSLDPSEVSK